MAWEPTTGALWTAVNERDELGSDLVPDYMTSVQDGGFYGWPYSYYGQHVDDAGQAAAARPGGAGDRARLRAGAAHRLAGPDVLRRRGTLPAQFASGAFVGQHGSWNRKPHSGYKVIFVPFADGKPAGAPVDVLTGFLDAEGNALGRPVGVGRTARAALLVADDVGNRVWRVSADSGRRRRDAIIGVQATPRRSGTCEAAPGSSRRVNVGCRFALDRPTAAPRRFVTVTPAPGPPS